MMNLMNLLTLLEKTPDTDAIRDMASFAAGRLMGFEVAALIGPRHGGTTPHQARIGRAGSKLDERQLGLRVEMLSNLPKAFGSGLQLQQASTNLVTRRFDAYLHLSSDAEGNGQRWV